MSETSSANAIRITLDAVRVNHNKSEYRNIPRARSSQGHEIVGDGPLVARMAAILREENPSFEGQLEVYRGDTLCFIPVPLKRAFLKGPQPEHLRRTAA
jgi:hypothetical protein